MIAQLACQTAALVLQLQSLTGATLLPVSVANIVAEKNGEPVAVDGAARRSSLCPRLDSQGGCQDQAQHQGRSRPAQRGTGELETEAAGEGGADGTEGHIWRL